MRVKFMRKNLKISLTGVILISVLHAFLHAQTTGPKKDIIIFKTNIEEMIFDRQDLLEPLKATENQVRELFSSLSGCNVYVLDYQLNEQNIVALLEKLKLFSGGGEIPANIEIGKTVFSKKDFAKIASSHLLVIPILNFYNIEEIQRDENISRYKTGIRFNYIIINSKEAAVLSTIVIQSTGYDEDKKKSILDALEDVPIQLNYGVRSLDVFSLADRIVEILDPEVVIKLGTDKGVNVGDEYAIMSLKAEEENAGSEIKESGLVIIHDKEENVSIGRVIYADEPFAIGTPVKEIPKLGLEMIPYVHVEIDFLGQAYYGWSGLKFVVTKGFFAIQPVVGMEIGLYPFERLQDELPLRVFAGIDFNIFLGRFQLIGMVAAGTEVITAMSSNSQGEGFDFSCFGLLGLATVSYLITRDLKLMLDLGYQAWFAYKDRYNSYEGWICGLGMGIKF
jgi:hypothetical protein